MILYCCWSLIAVSMSLWSESSLTPVRPSTNTPGVRERGSTSFTGWAMVVVEHVLLQSVRGVRRESERVRSAAPFVVREPPLDPSTCAADEEVASRGA